MYAKEEKNAKNVNNKCEADKKKKSYFEVCPLEKINTRSAMKNISPK